MDVDRWSALFADLETQWGQADAADLRAEVSDRSRSEQSLLRLVDRLRPSIGHPVHLRAAGGVVVSGALIDLGSDWLLLSEGGGWLVLVAVGHLVSVGGLGALSASPGSEGRVGAALDLAYALRRLARERVAVNVTLADGSLVTGTLDRVGADFVEVAEHAVGEYRRPAAVRQVRAVPLAAISMVRVG